MKNKVVLYLFTTLTILYIKSTKTFPLEIKDASGKQFKFNRIPNRIISLAPSITENLFLLGVGKKIVGNTTYCDFPEEAKKIEKVGTYIQPNIEKIVSLFPDIIFIPKEGMKKELIFKIQKLGLSIFVFDVEHDLDSLLKNFNILAKIVGKEKEGKKITEECKSRLTKIMQKTKKIKSRKKVFWQINAPVIMTSSGSTLQGNILKLAGAINIAESSKINYPRYSKEEVIKQNPDVIMIIDMGVITQDEINKWKKYKNIKAVRENKLFAIDANLVSRPVPTRFVEAVEKIYEIVYGY